MPWLSIPAGTTSKLIEFPIYDSSSAVGAQLAGLVYNSGSLTAYYDRWGAAGAATAMSLATMTKGTWATLGFVAVDGANMPGVYQLGIPDAALAAGAQGVTIHLKGATNMVPVTIVIELTATSNQDSVRGGMTALPNAAAGASGGLPLSVDTSGRVDVLKINGTSQTARDIGASVLLSAGTGTGQLDFTSGVVKANLAQILGTALTETAGYLAAAFKKFFNIATPASTMDALTLVATATNLTNAPTNGDLTATMKTSVTTACTAATPTVTAGTVSDKTGYSLTAGQVPVAVKKNTALSKFAFLMTDSTNHAPATGKTAACTRSIDGGAFAAGTLANVAELSAGIYLVDFLAADLNGGVITLRATASGCDDTFVTLVTAQ